MIEQEHPPAPTPLFELHQEAGGKMTNFAGYRLPLSYSGDGVLAEHAHTRNLASLFDVSHMGQLRISGAHAGKQLTRFVPADVTAMPCGTSRYTVLTNDDGGVIDDIIIANDGDKGFSLVANASRKTKVMKYLHDNLKDGCRIDEEQNLALLAVQGPAARAALSEVFPNSAIGNLRHMSVLWVNRKNITCRVMRGGYTGEDGFEISVAADSAVAVARELLALPTVKLAGLGARDSLRIEAGLCLYGNELNESITPVEAGLTWLIPRHRRTATAGYPGAAKISDEINNGTKRRLVGVVVNGRIPARHGAPLLAGGETIGAVTSGIFSPTRQQPIALAFVKNPPPDGDLNVVVRNQRIALTMATLPFVPHRYARGTNQ